MKKKQIAQLGVTLGLVAAVGVGGTLAILSAKSNVVTNTFAAGAGIDPNTDITLFESDQVKNNAEEYGFVVNEFENKATFKDNTPISEWKAADTIKTIDTDGVQYSELTPNVSVTKDPRVQIAEDTADCYLFVKVNNGLSGVTDVTVNGILSETGYTDNWKKLNGEDDVWYYVNSTDAANEEFTEGSVINTDTDMYVTEPVFDTITFGENADIYSEDFSSRNITVKALAVQATKKSNDGTIGTNWNDAVEIAKAVESWN